MTTIPKTKEQIEAEVTPGSTRLTRDTKVMALRTGYADSIREPGEIFYVKAGTIMEPECWFTPVADNTATTVETDAYEEMTVADLKIALSKRGIDFTGITRKNDLIDLLSRADYEGDVDDGADLA